MCDIEAIKAALAAYLSELGYQLYEVSFVKRANDLVLALQIDNNLDLNTLTILSEKISAFLDEKDYLKERYLLDVATVGLEREIKGHEALLKADGTYVHATFKQVINGMQEAEGTLKVNENDLTITYSVKNKKETVTFKEADLKKIRSAVKF